MTRPSGSPSLVWLAVLLLPSVVGGDEGKTLLRWKLRAGDDLKLQITQTNTMETLVKDRPLVMVVQMAMELAWHVDRVESDGTARVAQLFTRVLVKTSGQEAKSVQYDSSSASAPPLEMQELAQAVRRLLGTQCQVTLSARGEITDVKPAPETDSLLRHAPGAAGLLRLLTKAGINQTLRPALGLLPQSPVASGNTWHDTFAIDAPAGKIRLATTYTYQGPERLQDRSVERIGVATEVTAAPEESRPGETAAPVRQQYNGTLFFDASLGQLVQSELQQTALSEAAYHDKTVQLKASNTVVLRIRIREGGNSP